MLLLLLCDQFDERKGWWANKKALVFEMPFFLCYIILNKHFQLPFVTGCYGVPIHPFLCYVSILLPADPTNCVQVWWHWSKDHVQVLFLEISSHFINRFYHWKGWDCVARHHNIYLHSSIFQCSTISFWLSGSDHQRAVNLNSLIKYNGKKDRFLKLLFKLQRQIFKATALCLFPCQTLVSEGTHLAPERKQWHWS